MKSRMSLLMVLSGGRRLGREARSFCGAGVIKNAKELDGKGGLADAELGDARHPLFVRKDGEGFNGG